MSKRILSNTIAISEAVRTLDRAIFEPDEKLSRDCILDIESIIDCCSISSMRESTYLDKCKALSRFYSFRPVDYEVLFVLVFKALKSQKKEQRALYCEAIRGYILQLRETIGFLFQLSAILEAEAIKTKV
jgi:hypothetical protein